MWQGFCHVFLTAVWLKTRPNPMEIPSFSLQTPWKFYDLYLSKIHVMFEHGKQLKPGQMTWNSHEIGCEYGPNWIRFVTWWESMEFSWHSLRNWWDIHRILYHFRPNCRQKDMTKSLPHFLQGRNRNRNTEILDFSARIFENEKFSAWKTF